MKRTVGTFLLLASLGGGCVSADRASNAGPSFNRVGYAKEVKGVVGPMGQPIAVGSNGQAYMTPGDNAGVTPVNYSARGSGYDIEQAGLLRGGHAVSTGGCATCGNGGTGLGQAFAGDPGLGKHIGGPGHEWGGKGQAAGPFQHGPGMPNFYPGGGILNVPAMGPPGAVASVGALPGYGGMQPSNSRTSVKFADPAGMSVTWFGPNGLNEIPLTTPARYNFAQGGIYRLKISNINKHPGLELYPTLEVYPATPNSVTFLAHSSVPISFTDADVEQVSSGNFLTKVIYLPNPQYQDLSVLAGPTEIVSSPLEPGMDPIIEATKRGTVLLVIRMGNIDLQVPNSPAMDAPNPYMMPPPAMPQPVMPGAPGLVPNLGVPPVLMSPSISGANPTAPGKLMLRPISPMPAQMPIPTARPSTLP